MSLRKGIVLVAMICAAQAFAALKAPHQDGLVFIEWGQNHSMQVRQQMLEKLASTGSRHVTLVVFGCQSTITSSDVGSCQVHNPKYVFDTLKLAHRMGLEVTILPILTTPKWEWRGFFKPLDVNAWFKNYTIWITDIATEAQKDGAIELVMASEISSLYQYPDAWTTMAHQLRKSFSGNLIITANWDHFDFDFWPAVDAIGISAYFPIADSLNPSTQEMSDKWAEHKKKLLAVSKKYGKPLHFTEIGYESVAGAAKTPWAAPSTGEVDYAHQADCFQAFADAWKDEPALLRASIWASDDVDLHDDRSFDVLGKPAQKVLEKFFQERNAL